MVIGLFVWRENTIYKIVTSAFLIGIIAFGSLYFTVTTFGRYAAAATTIRYVTPAGSDIFTTTPNPCLDVNNPCLTLQHAVDMAESGDEIRLTAGQFAAVAVRQGITQVAYITKTITIIGGYPAGFGQAPDPQQYRSVLDAAGLGRVLVLNKAPSVIIQGVTISNGDADLFSGRGGGLYVVDSDVTLLQVALISNTAEFGGGLYGQNGRVELHQSQVASNTARYGGGLYAQQLVMTITDNEWHHNTAVLGGGAMRLYAGHTTVQDNYIANNTAGLHGAGVYVTRGQLMLRANRLQSNHIANMTQGWGGGLHLTGGAVAVLEANQFTDNTAAYGGGLRVLDSDVSLSRNLIRGNTALHGGGLALQGHTVANLRNNAIIDNDATNQGAGIYLQEAEAELKHTTLARNGGSGEAVVVDGVDSSLYMQNSILADHLVGVVKLHNSSQVLLESTLWDNNSTDTVGSVANIIVFTGNAAFAADGYHLLSGSAAIDVAPNKGAFEDIDGHVRPYYGGFDLGADEWSTLVAEKTASQTLIEPSERLTYTIRLQNSTGLPITAILTDSLPTEVVIFAPPLVSSGNWQINDTELNWEGIIPAAGVVTIEWPVQVVATLEKGDVIINTALVRDNIGRFESAPAISFRPVNIYLPAIHR